MWTTSFSVCNLFCVLLPRRGLEYINEIWKHRVLESTKICVRGESRLNNLSVHLSIDHTENKWWCHQMEIFFALLALYAWKSPVTGEFPSQRPVTRSLDVFFDLCLNKRLSKQLWRWWIETPSRSLWRHCNDVRTEANVYYHMIKKQTDIRCRLSTEDTYSRYRWTRYWNWMLLLGWKSIVS